ncbi:MAG TPA: hypothetical protein PJ982_14815, partial [Lacipirellulaceae bacterium]|nr:hypothetical protein [Lacipirellulaceae bacterium]
GGLLAHDIGGSFSTAMDYMQQVYNQSAIWNSLQADVGVRYPWQDFGYHFYISQGSAVTPAQLTSYFNAVRSTQTAHGDSTPILVTEFGWQTVGTNTEELQRDNMATAYDVLAARSDVSGTYWYQWEDDPTGAWGLVHGNGAPKLAYHEFAARNQASSPVIFTTHHAANDAALPYAMSSTDLLQGLIAVERPGDLGWHGANPASGNSMNPNGLPALTDGVGDLGSGLTGLLNDFPASGAAAKKLEYDLGGAHRIDEVRIFTGNSGNDGRIFSTTAIWTSSDGQSFELLGYFQSDPSGTTNNASTPGGPHGATVVRIARGDGTPLIDAATHLRFDLFATSDLEGVMRDPFDGVNTFTGVDDGLSRAYVSPLVREIDVFGTPATTPSPADFNGDGHVDGDDLLVWTSAYITPTGAGRAQGDASGDGAVDGADFLAWQRSLTAAATAAVPEPQAAHLLWGVVTVIAGLGRGASRTPSPGARWRKKNGFNWGVHIIDPGVWAFHHDQSRLRRDPRPVSPG